MCLTIFTMKTSSGCGQVKTTSMLLLSIREEWHEGPIQTLHFNCEAILLLICMVESLERFMVSAGLPETK